MSAQDHPSIPNIGAMLQDRVVQGWRKYPVKSLRASSIGHPCLRYLCYERLAWQDAAQPDPGLLVIFREGSLHERDVIQRMLDAGLKVIEQQTSYEWRKFQITGHIDGMLMLGDETIPFDIKSVSSYTFDSVKTVEDLIMHKYHYVRGWRSQMTIYMLLTNRERSVLILKNKSTGEIRHLVLPLDFAHGEELLAKAEAVNAAVAEGRFLDRMPYAEDICGRCDHFASCLPDEALRGGLQLLDDPDLVAQIRRRLELEPGAKEFDKLDRQIKDRCKQAFADEGGTAEAVVGTEFLVRISQQNRKGYEVAPGVVTTVKIQRLGKANGEGREEVAS